MSLTNPSNFQQVADSIARQVETEILEQLGELVSKKLLVLETGATTLVQDPMDLSFRVCRRVKLHLKDREYIAELEAQNKKLLGELAAIAGAVAGHLPKGHR